MRQKPDALIAATDMLALGALDWFGKNGVNVPRDVRVIGFDDSFVASLVSPALSSIHVPAELIGRYAMELALSRIEDFSQPARLRSVAAELAVRGSTNPDAAVEPGLCSW